jgi:hypothetical protein
VSVKRAGDECPSFQNMKSTVAYSFCSSCCCDHVTTARGCTGVLSTHNFTLNCALAVLHVERGNFTGHRYASALAHRHTDVQKTWQV